MYQEKLKKKGRKNLCVIQNAAMSKLHSRKGFGLKSNLTDDLPFAVALLDTRSDLLARSYPSLNVSNDEMIESIQPWSTSNLDADLKYAILKAFEAFKLPEYRVNPIHLNDIFNMDLEIRGSSPRNPWQPDYKTKGDIMDSSAARRDIRWYWCNVKKGKFVYLPYTRVLYRAHSTDGDTPKIQAVCEYPATMKFGEAQFARPLIEAYKKETTPMAYGYDMSNSSALKLGHELYHNIDCKKFNETVSDLLIGCAFLILTQNIDFKRYKVKGVPDARKLFRAWVHIINYFKHTLVRLPNGDQCQKIAGIPSDSYFTQLISSIVNYIYLSYAVLKLTDKMPKYIRVGGDSAVIVTHSIIDKCELDRIIDSIGMELQGVKYKEL